MNIEISVHRASTIKLLGKYNLDGADDHVAVTAE